MGVLAKYSLTSDIRLSPGYSEQMMAMRVPFGLCLCIVFTLSLQQTEASPRVPVGAKVSAGAKRAAGFDYDYYNPYAFFQQKRAPGFDYDYYNPYSAYQFHKRGAYCLQFGMSCSVKGIACCGDKVECRCNLFNTNCKCQRASMFGR